MKVIPIPSTPTDNIMLWIRGGRITSSRFESMRNVYWIPEDPITKVLLDSDLQRLKNSCVIKYLMNSRLQDCLLNSPSARPIKITSKCMHGMNQTEAEYSRQHGSRSQRTS